jgi:hypothetical protein
MTMLTLVPSTCEACGCLVYTAADGGDEPCYCARCDPGRDLDPGELDDLDEYSDDES